MKLPLIHVNGISANMEALSKKTLSTLSISVMLDMLDMLEGSVRQIPMSVLLVFTTMGLCSRMESMATPASG